MSKQWMLESTAAMHVAHPNTFLIPSVRERNNLRVGDVVKLIFASLDRDIYPERMWVEVVKVGPGRRYVGRLDIEPFNLPGLHLNDIIHFRADDVASLTQREEIEAYKRMA